MADLPSSPGGAAGPPDDAQGLLARLAARFTAWAERWIPDAFVFALVGHRRWWPSRPRHRCCCRRRTRPTPRSRWSTLWGGGFWELLPFTLQMALVIITGYVVATTRPVYRLIVRARRVPKSPRAAIAWVALFAMLSSWLNWGFSLIFSAMLAREVARRVAGVDYRAVRRQRLPGPRHRLGAGPVGLRRAADGDARPRCSRRSAPSWTAAAKIPGGIIPFTHTIFLWQSLVSVAIEVAVVTALVYFAAPSAQRARTAADLGIDLGASPLDAPDPPRKGTPGEWLEHVPLLSALFVLLAGALSRRATSSPAARALNALTLNTINLVFLTVGVALHGTPARLMRAVKEATPGVWGVHPAVPVLRGHRGAHREDAAERGRSPTSSSPSRRPPPSPRSSRPTRRCSASSCPAAARSGSSRRPT